MADPPAWKRPFTLESVPELYRSRLERARELLETDSAGKFKGSTVAALNDWFFGVLNDGPNSTACRNDVATNHPRPATTPEEKEARTRLILSARLQYAWHRVWSAYPELHAAVREAEEKEEIEAGAGLFSEVIARIRAHYYLEEEWHYTICGLFVMQCWAVRAGVLPAVFYLYFGGSMSSGKSNILHLISSLTDGLMLENVSPSAVARIISSDGDGRALLLDEIDVERGQELDDVMAALLRSGYRRNGPPYVRWNAKEKKAESFSVFGPKAGSYRSSLDPALQSRGFVIPTAKPVGEDYYGLVLANLWPKTADLVPRLRAWGQATAPRWGIEALEEVARSTDFQAEVRRVTGMLGANRESELVTIALLVARMVPIDAASSLQNAAELRKVEISEDQVEAIEEVRDATLTHLAKAVSFAADGREVYRVAQKSVRDEISRRRKERQERPITPGRLALLRRELGIKDAWLVEKGHRIVWNLPKSFVESIQIQPSALKAPEGSGDTHPSGYSPPPTLLPPYSLTEGNSPQYSPVASTDVGMGSSGEQGSTGGVPGGGYMSGNQRISADSGPAPVVSPDGEASASVAEGNWSGDGVVGGVTQGNRGADPEDLFDGGSTRADRTRSTWDAAHPGSTEVSALRRRVERAQLAWEEEGKRRASGVGTLGALWSAIGPFVEYPDRTVTVRATGEVLWREGDPPDDRPWNPVPGTSNKPHNIRRGLR